MSRSHTRQRKQDAKRRRAAYLTHLADKPRRNKAKREKSNNRRDEIERTVKVLGVVHIEKGTEDA